ncbi:MAG: PP2C family protein-serine/threonine phosphatase [Vicinamibacterales bacterium]
MSLRTRLIIAFLLLSVVPLSAVTFLSYLSSVRAFEQAAQREATESAIDVSRRMEMITADVARRMDRLFAAGTTASAGSPAPDPQMVRQTVAPLLGDTAALVERMEFHPSPDAPAAAVVTNDPNSVPIPIPPQRGGGGRRRGQFGGGPPRAPAAPGTAGFGSPPGPPPPGSQVIVMDIPRIVAEATRAASAAGLAAADDPKVRAIIDKQIEQQLAANQQNLKAMAAALSREAASRAAGERMAVDLQGQKIEVEIQKDGRVIGHANAMLNLDRMLRGVLGFARRDQGEIPFAIDRQSALYTPEPADKTRLEALGVERTAMVAASGTPRRSGDWIIVSRRAPSGIIFGIARPIGASLREIQRAAVRNLGLGLLVIALAFIGIIPISHRMTQHLATLTRGVHQLAGGDFTTRVPVRSKDEFGALAGAFNQMAEDLERHEVLVVEQERLRKELELSRLIQTEMLPRESLRFGPAEISGVSIPAREVGGDFFNYFVLPDRRLALLVGDVSGKGVSAALLMANIQATLRARLPHETNLAMLADRLDRELDQNTPGGVYLTLFLGILETDGRLLRYVNAGHNPQFVLHGAAGASPLGSTGMPIALYAGHGYTEARVELSPGDLLFFYTDGLVETENERNEMFGAERLQEILEGGRAESIHAILQNVEQTVATFRGSAEPFDDATMMALRIS